MTIRSRLLILLLPLLLGFIIIISVLYYFSWHKNILTNYQMRVESVVSGCAALLDENRWQELQFADSAESQRTMQSFHRITQQLPLIRIYALPNDLSIVQLPLFAHLDEKAKAGLFGQRRTIVTQPYASGDKKKFTMTAIAPVLSANGQIAAFVLGDIDASALHRDFDKALSLILLEGALTLLFVTSSVYFVASRISRPVEKLKDSALSIAAGEYGKSIQIKGPKEIVELAHTLNTMSECLQEHMTRLTESSFLREQMHSEYECSVLLQHQMWKHVVETLVETPLLFKTIDIFCSPLHGMLLDASMEGDDALSLHMVETEKTGFQGIYELLTHTPFHGPETAGEIPYPFLKLDFSLKTLEMRIENRGMPAPIVWSTALGKPLEPHQGRYSLQPGDLLFAPNIGLLRLLQTQEALAEWLQRTLRHFAGEGLESCVSLLDKELLFTTRKKTVKWDIHLLCIQVLPT